MPEDEGEGRQVEPSRSRRGQELQVSRGKCGDV